MECAFTGEVQDSQPWRTLVAPVLISRNLSIHCLFPGTRLITSDRNFTSLIALFQFIFQSFDGLFAATWVSFRLPAAQGMLGRTLSVRNTFMFVCDSIRFLALVCDCNVNQLLSIDKLGVVLMNMAIRVVSTIVQYIVITLLFPVKLFAIKKLIITFSQ